MNIQGKYDNIEFFAANICKGLNSFQQFQDAQYEETDNWIRVLPGGYAGQVLSGEYADALTQSKYMCIQARAYIPSISTSLNYKDSVEMVLTGWYSLGGQTYTYYQSIPFTELGQEISAGVISLKRIVVMPNATFQQLTVYFKNNSTNYALLEFLSILRSKDISGDQVADSINTNVGLTKVVTYATGFELYYENSPRPVRIWWMGDKGLLEALDVNHQKIIPIINRRMDEML